MGGYAYAFSDMVPTIGSVSCLNGTSFCGAGSIGIANPAMNYTVYGGGIGVDVNEPAGTTTGSTLTPTGKAGISYSLSNVPVGLFILVDQNPGAVRYQAAVPSTATAATMVPWTSFTLAPGQGDAGAASLSGPPSMTHINFQINSAATASTFNFCVTSLAFY